MPYRFRPHPGLFLVVAAAMLCLATCVETADPTNPGTIGTLQNYRPGCNQDGDCENTVCVQVLGESFCAAPCDDADQPHCPEGLEGVCVEQEDRWACVLSCDTEPCPDDFVCIPTLLESRTLALCLPSQSEDDEATCSDGVDNDGDGRTDCDAPSCSGVATCGACSEGMTQCDGTCVSLADSDLHCGVCGNACALGGERCVAGTCLPLDCLEVPCGDEEVCVDELCTGVACLTDPCGPDEACVGGTCLPRHCEGHTCAVGTVCIEDVCVELACVDVTCDALGACIGGVCYRYDCEEILCGEGEVCVDELCTEARCVGVVCGSGERCVESLCVPDTCAGVMGQPCGLPGLCGATYDCDGVCDGGVTVPPCACGAPTCDDATGTWSCGPANFGDPCDTAIICGGTIGCDGTCGGGNPVPSCPCGEATCEASGQWSTCPGPANYGQTCDGDGRCGGTFDCDGTCVGGSGLPSCECGTPTCSGCSGGSCSTYSHCSNGSCVCDNGNVCGCASAGPSMCRYCSGGNVYQCNEDAYDCPSQSLYDNCGGAGCVSAACCDPNTGQACPCGCAAYGYPLCVTAYGNTLCSGSCDKSNCAFLCQYCPQ